MKKKINKQVNKSRSTSNSSFHCHNFLCLDRPPGFSFAWEASARKACWGLFGRQHFGGRAPANKEGACVQGGDKKPHCSLSYKRLIKGSPCCSQLLFCRGHCRMLRPLFAALHWPAALWSGCRQGLAARQRQGAAWATAPLSQPPACPGLCEQP